MKKLLAIIALIGLLSVSAFAADSEMVYCVVDDLYENSNCVAFEMPATAQSAAFCDSWNADDVSYTAYVEESLDEVPGACTIASQVPEFGTIGAAIALLGSAGAYFKRKKAFKRV